MGDMREAFDALNEHKKEVRQSKEPNRFRYAVSQLDAYKVVQVSPDCLAIRLSKGIIRFFPYTGWYQGQKPYGQYKGRGVKNLLAVLKWITKENK